MQKRYNVLTTRASFFISSAGKTENLREFKIKFFKQLFLIANDSHIKNVPIQ